MRVLTIPLFYLIFSFSYAQQISVDERAYGYYDYAFNFSETNLTGSSRALGFGGAQHALGADIGTQAANPAGLGLYRKSDWGISFSNDQISASSELRTSVEQTKNRLSTGNFNVPNLGFIFGSKEDDPDKGPWKSQAFGISLTRLNSYHQSFSYTGKNKDYSLRNYLVNSANGTHWSAINSQLDDDDDDDKVDDIWGGAYWAYLLNAVNENGTTTEQETYFTFDPDQEDKIEERITQSGRSSQWNIGYGANYEDQLFIGANLGIQSIKREIASTYSESLVEIDNHALRSFTYNENEITRGTGINFSFGLIYKPTNALRIGFTYKSPTSIALREEFSAKVTAKYNNYQIPNSAIILTEKAFSTKNYLFEYQLTTPSKYSFGSAYFFQKKGFITADVDFTAYSRMILKTSQATLVDDPLIGDNATINNIYRTAVNLRVGGEYRYNSLRVRAGYAHFGNPYRKAFNTVNESKNIITGGLGIRLKEYYIDAASVFSFYKDAHKPYAFANGGEPVVFNNYTSFKLVFTVGMFF